MFYFIKNLELVSDKINKYDVITQKYLYTYDQYISYIHMIKYIA